MAKLTAQARKELIEAARQANKKSYAPYSRYYVGAAILTEAGNIYTGCNVENASYGMTICAERNAIAKAISEEGEGMRLVATAIVNRHEGECSPCGACRQVICEFGDRSLVIYKGGTEWVETPLYTLLPGTFDLPSPEKS